MTRLSGRERIENINRQIERLEKQRKALLAEEKKRLEDERRQRLIDIGKLAEKYFLCDMDDLNKVNLYFAVIADSANVKELISQRHNMYDFYAESELKKKDEMILHATDEGEVQWKEKEI